MATDSYDLVVLAAGLGSRFGGLKQVQPVGPDGELIIEYSVHDAMRAGFTRLVLVIRRGIEADFRAVIGRRLESQIEVSYVYQELAALPIGFSLPPGRTKPWGTGQAVLAARTAVRRQFAVINADDFYGAAGFRALAGHFCRQTAATRPDYALVGYPLRLTLSEHGVVSRGLCTIDTHGKLERVSEITGISTTATGAVYTAGEGQRVELSGDEIVSMNFWGFTPTVFDQLEELFSDFLARQALDLRAEFYLPTAIDTLCKHGEAAVTVLPSADAWFGLTHQADLASARGTLRSLVAARHYSAPLWR